MKRTGTFLNERYNRFVPGCGYAADAVHGQPQTVDFGTPAATDADAILNDQSIGTAGSTTTFLDDESDANFGRNVVVVASGAATSTVTVHGWDYHGQPMTETLTLNGATPVVGKKAFMKLREVEFGATAATTIDLGWGTKFGVPYRITHCLGEQADGVAAAAGTVTAGIRTDPQTATTADPRGLYVPTTTPDGSKRLIGFFLLDPHTTEDADGMLVGGLMGIAHYSA